MSEDYDCVNRVGEIINNNKELSMIEVDKKIASYLKTIELNKNSESGFSPLYRAADLGEFNVVQAMLNNGADPNIRSVNGKTPIFIASAKGHLDVVTHLVNKGANVNLEDNEKKTPLMFAAGNGKLEVTKYLVNQNSHLNVSDIKGNTALLYGFKVLNKGVVEFLINSGADMSIKNHNGVSGNLIKQTVVNTYNKIKQQEAAKEIKGSSPERTKDKSSTKFRDMVVKSRQNKNSRGVS